MNRLEGVEVPKIVGVLYWFRMTFRMLLSLCATVGYVAFFYGVFYENKTYMLLGGIAMGVGFVFFIRAISPFFKIRIT